MIKFLPTVVFILASMLMFTSCDSSDSDIDKDTGSDLVEKITQRF